MSTHELAPGKVLGRYELLLPIASGGMATVWVARSKGSRGFSKTVAVKTILPNLSDDPTFEQMFLDEAKIASRIQHPNVVQIIDLGEEDEILYLAMEMIDGESLSTLSKFARKNNTDIPLRIGVKIIAQACAGLHAAHELRDDDDRHLELVHRDVSPQNILVSSGGIVKIVDFGVAKALGRGGETSAGQLKGKVPFMSPEQAKGGNVDRRTDIFALGILLYRVATGAHPFIDETDIKTMRNIISRPAMPPRVKSPSCPVDLERTILKALQKDPSKRHATCVELENELEAILAANGGPVSIDEVSTFVRATMGERDRKRRASIRDAALRMDEQAMHPMPSIAPQANDSVSGVMLTKTQTPSHSLSGAETRAQAGPAETIKVIVPAAPIPSSPGADRAEPTTPTSPPLASSPTLVALESAREKTPTSLSGRNGRKTRTIAIAAAIACGVGGGAFLFAKLGGAPQASSAAESTNDAKNQKTETQQQGAGASATTTAQTAQKDEARPAEQPSGTAVDVNALPDNSLAGTASASATSTVAAVPTYTGRPVNTTATATAKPTATTPATATVATATATQKPTATAQPTTKPTGNSNVPAVQNPGF